MAPRIPTRPADLAVQCSQAAAGITGEPAWPATAPTSAQMTARAASINAALLAVADLEAQIAVARESLASEVTFGRAEMNQIDSATDLLYGEDGAEKLNFGLPPKKTTPTPLGLPTKVVIRAILDGPLPASILVDWEAEENAAYEIQWFTDAAMTVLVGSATSTASEYVITGLQKATQYWLRVRAVRAGQHGPWSDPATRVAGV